MAWRSTASYAASSLSNTRAGPRCSRRLAPEIFITAPSGARLPRRITSPPELFSARSTGRTTSCPGVSTASIASTPMVRPLTVAAARWSRPASSSRRATRRLPPAACRSVATNRPDGLRSASSGTRALMRSKSASDSSRPVSCAIAIKCRTALVEPPVVATAAIAFSRASCVMMSRGRTPRRTRSMTNRPTPRATSRFSVLVAGTLPVPSAAIPRNSDAMAMVFAVNCPPHAPTPGQADASSPHRSSSLRRPAL